MIYVISDLHGYPLDRFTDLLEKADFSSDDTLYVLGDVIDRNGDGGVETLRWMMRQDNVELLRGNHETMLLSCGFLFDEITDDSIEALDEEKLSRLNTYLYNGGSVTLKSLRRLNKTDPDEVADILDYLREAPLYKMITAGGRDHLLVHGGLENFDKNRRLSDYADDELVWARPEKDDDYFDDVYTVIGHTPTLFFGSEYKGRVYRTRTWMCIDTGAGIGEAPVLVRLDDGKEFR